MERKYLDLQVKSAGNLGDEGNGYLEGYGAVKGNIDSYGDVIRDGAFKNLEALVGKGFAGKGHDWTDAIGYVEEAREDEHGLWVKMAFHSTQDAQDVRTKVQERLAAGRSVGLSIGYFTKVASPGKVEGKDVRFLDEIEVFEVSVVTMPANERATVLSAKAQDGPPKSFGDEFTVIEQMAVSFVDRAAKVAPERGESWKAERCEQYRRMAETLTKAAEELEPQDQTPTPEIDADELDALIAKAEALIQRT
jgi:HK97 family phage prohead protease